MKAFEPFPALLGDLYVASEYQRLLFPRTGKKRMRDGRGLPVRRASRDLYANYWILCQIKYVLAGAGAAQPGKPECLGGGAWYCGVGFRLGFAK